MAVTGVEPISGGSKPPILNLCTIPLWTHVGEVRLELTYREGQYGYLLTRVGFTDQCRYSPIICTPNRIRTGISTLRGWPPKPISKIGAYISVCQRTSWYWERDSNPCHMLERHIAWTASRYPSIIFCGDNGSRTRTTQRDKLALLPFNHTSIM